MKQSDKNKVKDRIENEGFDYTFVGYSSFGEVKDEQFHKLRLNYIETRRLLADYIGYSY